MDSIALPYSNEGKSQTWFAALGLQMFPELRGSIALVIGTMASASFGITPANINERTFVIVVVLMVWVIYTACLPLSLLE